MTLVISHAFVSAKGDGTDATLVRPSNWNAAHASSMATGNILGNTSGGIGPILEIPATPFALAALAATDGPSFMAALGLGGFSTGDAKYSINPTPATGWLVYQGVAGTLGDASSGATVRANADTSALFQLIWNQISSPSANVACPVIGGLGANAAADYAAHKVITLPGYSGRAMIGAGASTGLTTRTLGIVGGVETFSLTTANLPPYTPSGGVSTSISHNANTDNSGGLTPGTGAPVVTPSGATITASSSFAGNAQGGTSVAFTLMQPYNVMWTHLKL